MVALIWWNVVNLHRLRQWDDGGFVIARNTNYSIKSGLWFPDKNNGISKYSRLKTVLFVLEAASS